MYSALYRSFSFVGLAIASDLGIAANCIVTAVLLHQSKLVAGDELPWKELGKAAATAVAAGLVSLQIARVVPIANSRVADVKALGLITVTWAAATAAGLWLLRSQLPRDLRRRRGTIYPRVAESQAEQLAKGIDP